MGVKRDYDFLSLSFPPSSLCSICFLDLSKYWADISVALSFILEISLLKGKTRLVAHRNKIVHCPLWTNLHLLGLNVVSICISARKKKKKSKENAGAVLVCRSTARWQHCLPVLPAKQTEARWECLNTELALDVIPTSLGIPLAPECQVL